MLEALKLYAIALVVFLVADALWIGLLARSFYQQQLAPLLRSPPNWTPAILFYLLFIAGLLVFVVQPALERGSLMHAVWRGAFFGIVAYATYDLTNLATMRDFPPIVAIVDLLWGTAVAAIVSATTYAIAR